MEFRSRTLLGTARKNLRRRLRPDIQITPPPEQVRFERDLPIVVRDGTTLRANVFRPEGEGRYPVLLCAAPYGKDRMPTRTRAGWRKPLQYRLASNDAPMSFSAWAPLEGPDPAFWVPRGYAVVTVDLRGWGTSDGDPEPFGPTEGEDVHDCIEWAAAQSWATGRVGMTGVSYLAISQWTAAATRPPHLSAINPWEGFTDGYRDFAYPGAVREDGFMRTWSTWQKLMRPRSPSFRGGQKRHPLRDEWWQRRSAELEKIEVPALVCASFSDHSLHSRGSFEGFSRIASTQKWLYTHRGPKWSTYYGEQALHAQTRFFDHFLQDRDTGILQTSPVRIEIRQGRREIAEVKGSTEWPPSQTRPVCLQLDAGNHTMGPEAPVVASATRVASRQQFRLRLEEQTDLVGPMRLRIPVSVAGNDLTLFAGVRKISAGREVVFEGSYGFTEDLVTRGWLRASHRAVDDAGSTVWEAHHPHTAAAPLQPNHVVDLDLTLLPSATRFAAGDELVLELRDHWFFAGVPLLGQFPAVYERSPRQSWWIHTGGEHRASLTVPLWDDNHPTGAADASNGSVL